MTPTTKEIEGLGSVTLMDTMGSDVSVANVARVSLGRTASEMTDKEESLIKFLWKNGHTSPFRHQHLQFHIKAPIFVIRQWMKHTVGCAWNERSGRYVQFDQEHVRLGNLYEVDPKKKQGVGPLIVDYKTRSEIDALMGKAFKEQHAHYEALIEKGLSREQARTVLGTGYLTECYWTCSLHAYLHFLKLRLDEHTQYETRLFAQATLDLVRQTGLFDVTLSTAFPTDEAEG